MVWYERCALLWYRTLCLSTAVWLILGLAQSALAIPFPGESQPSRGQQQSSIVDQTPKLRTEAGAKPPETPLLSICTNQSICADPLSTETTRRLPYAFSTLLEAIDVMQSEYFELWAGTWPSSIDWTAAVLGTHVSATLTTIVSTFDYSNTWCVDMLEWENTINRYFSHLTAFYFGENAFSLRNQAYDDMLWVVLGWLENVKFSTHYSRTYWENQKATDWYGTQLKGPAAHRARIFYEIAAHGWDKSLCGGGMTWNPALEPYKNSITNELFISASIAMYLYFPGDNNDSPFMAADRPPKHPPHEHAYLESAKRGYDWLKSSNLTNDIGLYMDGYHITGWHRYRNGTVIPGTGKCDKLDSMVYTYNQGVLLSGLKGLWIATNNDPYLDDAHTLIQNVINATGWGHRHDNKRWAGLGRGGVLEEYCDSSGDCSQNGHTFKGIFFHHLAEFCRPLWQHEEDFMLGEYGNGLDESVYTLHHYRCLSYTAWIEHNARAAVATKNEHGMYGTWWGRPHHESSRNEEDTIDIEIAPLPDGAVDYRNAGIPKQAPWLSEPEDQSGAAAHEETEEEEEEDGHNRPPRRKDPNTRGRGRTVETQSGGVAVFRALWQWQALVSRPIVLRGRESP